MNKKFLYRDKAFLYAKQNRVSAYDYAALSRAAYDSIIQETSWFNDTLKNGKWKGMMSMKPRELPAFQVPDLPVISLQKSLASWDVVPEGYDIASYNQKAEKKLPQFIDGMQQKYFADIFLKDSIEISWNARTSANWIVLSHTSGKLLPIAGKSSQRIWIHIDPKKLGGSTNDKGFIEFSAGEKAISIAVEVFQPTIPYSTGYRNFECNGYVSINAANCSKFTGKDGSSWEQSTYWRSPGVMMEARVAALNAIRDTTNLLMDAAYTQYEFYSFSNDTPAVSVFTLPTHPLNKDFSMRYGVSIDGGPVQIVDFRTFGRSEEWKQNVLRNNAIRTIKFAPLGKGKHVLRIHLIDPYVVLDRILINFSNRQEAYGAIRPTIRYY